jgi:hypothetical protein
MVIIVSCNSDNKKTKNFISHFFDINFEFTCTDSKAGKVSINALNSQLNVEAMAFITVVPDSVLYSDFYNAYINRILDAYYLSEIALDKSTRDSLLTIPNCDTELVKEKVKKHYCNDPVFFNVFKTALESYYGNSENINEVQFSEAKKVKLPLDTLIQISLLQYDIVSYDTIKGFGYHEVCGTNPYSYAIGNVVNLLIPGFCQEALRNKDMRNVHSKIMKELRKQVKEDYPGEKDDIKGLCHRYQDKLREMLVKEGTLKKSLLDYYDKRKTIEPFVLVDSMN